MQTDPLFNDAGRAPQPLSEQADLGAAAQMQLDEHFPWHRIRRMPRK